VLSLFRASGVDASGISGVSISCVVPPLKAVFEQLARVTSASSPAAGARHPDRLSLNVENPREVGADRVANALAAHRLYGGRSS